MFETHQLIRPHHTHPVISNLAFLSSHCEAPAAAFGWLGRFGSRNILSQGRLLVSKQTISVSWEARRTRKRVLLFCLAVGWLVAFMV